MPGTGANVSITGLQSVMSRIESLPAETQRQILEDVANYGISAVFSEYPERVNHGPGRPYIWTSEKQRRAFFASDGFGRGIPTKRTNELQKSWNYIIGQGEVKFINQANYAEYVVGKNIQPGHVADGWQNMIAQWPKKLSFQSSKFRAIVMEAVQKAIRKVKLG